MNLKRAQAGFTLLEVLMAATLLAVMMVLLLGALRIGARSWEGGERRAAAMSRMLATQNFLRAHLTAALPLKETARADEEPDVAASPLLFEGGKDRLAYAGTLPAQVRGGLYRFELYVAEHNERRDLKLAIMPLVKPAGGAGDSGTKTIEDVTLLENLDTLRITYLNQTTPDQPPAWQEDWRQATLPALIKLEIAPRDEAPWPELMIAPRIEVRQ